MSFDYDFTENIRDLPTDVSTEIIGKIFLQSKILLPDGNYPEAEKFSKVVLDVMHKLFAMRYHMINYMKLEQSHIKECGRINSSDTQNIPMTGDLSFEFESFLFQTKSALDITVKVLEVLFPGHFHVHTFENKGKTLIKNLEQFKKEPLFRRGEKLLKYKDELVETRKRRIATIDSIINRIDADQILWLDKAITMRTTFSHYSMIRGTDYRVERTGLDQIIVSTPKLDGLDPCEFMEITFNSCIELIQDFICLSIELWLPGSFELNKANTSNPAVYAWSIADPTLARFLEFTLGYKDDKR
jgi:hypothetical protein